MSGKLETMTPELKAFIEEWKTKPGNLIMVLHRVQQTYGYIPREIAIETAQLLEVPLAKIYGVKGIFVEYIHNLEVEFEDLVQQCIHKLRLGDHINQGVLHAKIAPQTLKHRKADSRKAELVLFFCKELTALLPDALLVEIGDGVEADVRLADHRLIHNTDILVCSASVPGNAEIIGEITGAVGALGGIAPILKVMKIAVTTFGKVLVSRTGIENLRELGGEFCMIGQG